MLYTTQLERMKLPDGGGGVIKRMACFNLRGTPAAGLLIDRSCFFQSPHTLAARAHSARGLCGRVALFSGSIAAGESKELRACGRWTRAIGGRFAWRTARRYSAVCAHTYIDCGCVTCHRERRWIYKRTPTYRIFTSTPRFQLRPGTREREKIGRVELARSYCG